MGKYTNKPPAHEIPEDYLADETFAAILKEAENSEIVEIVRGMSVSLTDLPELLQTIKSGGTLGQNVPKSADKEDSE